MTVDAELFSITNIGSSTTCVESCKLLVSFMCYLTFTALLLINSHHDVILSTHSWAAYTCSNTIFKLNYITVLLFVLYQARPNDSFSLLTFRYSTSSFEYTFQEMQVQFRDQILLKILLIWPARNWSLMTRVTKMNDLNKLLVKVFIVLFVPMFLKIPSCVVLMMDICSVELV